MRLLAALLATIVLLIILRDLLRPLLYNPGPVVATVAALAAIVVLIRVGQHYEWTGFGESSYPKSDSQEVQPGKTLWDWLQLLIVPLALALIVLVWSTAQEQASQTKMEERRAAAQRHLVEQQAQDEALQAYLDVMKELLLERDLRDSGPDSSARAVANVQTLVILERLDGRRKRAVLRLLTDSHLIDADAPLVETPALALQAADAEGMDLSDTDLSRADLSEANLKGANLEGANLSHATIYGADLSDADLSDANLSHANVARWFSPRALRRNVNLGGATLKDADLSDAKLSGANLSDAKLSRANLSSADLSDALGITNEELEQQAASLEGATMPNGQKYEDWLRSKAAEKRVGKSQAESKAKSKAAGAAGKVGRE
jgi:uncharacterized protein YjbI with pentapeptide repeats